MGDGEAMGGFDDWLSALGLRGDIPAESSVELRRGVWICEDVSGEGVIRAWLVVGINPMTLCGLCNSCD